VTLSSGDALGKSNDPQPEMDVAAILVYRSRFSTR